MNKRGKTICASKHTKLSEKVQYNKAWKHSRKHAFESFERKAKCQEDFSRGVVFNTFTGL